MGHPVAKAIGYVVALIIVALITGDRTFAAVVALAIMEVVYTE